MRNALIGDFVPLELRGDVVPIKKLTNFLNIDVF
jgi:hypothetical protein